MKNQSIKNMQHCFYPGCPLYDLTQFDVHYVLAEYFHFLIMQPYIKQSNFLPLSQGRHGKFEPGKDQYSTPKGFDRLFLIRAY